MTSFSPRPSQQRILAYSGGRLGISAVPGSGKTHTLSALAAALIAQGRIAADQEVLIVTLVNSAVDNFAHRIGNFIRTEGLLPDLGYRVRTLHGLAHDIVREKPARVGLEEGFQIIDEQEANLIRADAVRAFLQTNPGILEDYLDATLEERARAGIRRKPLPELAEEIAHAFIRSAKDHRLTPEQLRSLGEAYPAPLPLFEMGMAIYSDYQRALRYRGAVDFDDLIRLSYDLLAEDAEYLERLRYRFPFILEDEAQDSSDLQEQILALLAGPAGNWVRVGDPNQAIFETFTTASPEFLRRFIAGNPHVDMPESGRSQPAIIALANQLIAWTRSEHPQEEARAALTPPFIQPTSPDDPQQNPPDNPAGIHLLRNKYTAEGEIEAVVSSLEKWLPDHQDWSVAVLVPRNARGVELIDALKKKGLNTVEFLASTSNTRRAAGSLNHLLDWLSEPGNPAKLVKAYQVWRRDWRGVAQHQPLLKRIGSLLRHCAHVEDFLAPTADQDWLAALVLSPEEEAMGLRPELDSFRQHTRRWLAGVSLPIDQLILTLGVDVFTEPADLALVHKLALVLRQAVEVRADWRLPEITAELAAIARNERRFLGFSKDDSGFDPERYRGSVVVTTMHKAKGLEWDRVYLMSVNNYDFPSNQPNDHFISEKWFIRQGLNLPAEALAQLQAVISPDEYSAYTEGEATSLARLDYVKERLRLLYVGITRARKELVITFNTGRQGEAQPALGLAALQGWWQDQTAGRKTAE